MSEQNIFDNAEFFNGYYALRERDDCYNDLLEQPAMSASSPICAERRCSIWAAATVTTARILCAEVRGESSASIFHKKCSTSRRANRDTKIEYINMSMTEIGELDRAFDLVYSSLAFHYIEDFESLTRGIYSRLNDGGHLLFSQEHPIVTATLDGAGHFNKNERGEKVSYTFSNYCQSGMRTTHWYVDGVLKFHRPMGELLTTIAKTGFIIEEVNEPTPKPWAIEKSPTIVKEFLKPSFLIVKARKC